MDALCLNFGVYTEELNIQILTETQLIECESVVIGCLDDINPITFPFRSHQKVFDMCELSNFERFTLYDLPLYPVNRTE